MAEALTGIITEVVALMEGTKTPTPDRAISSGDFVHYNQPIEDSRLQTASAPYPFNLIGLGWDPGALEIQANVSGNYRYDVHMFEIRVGYSHRRTERLSRQDTIRQDYFKIRRTLTDPQAYSATGFCGMLQEGDPTITEKAIGSDTQVELMDLLTIPFTLLYREDHT